SGKLPPMKTLRYFSVFSGAGGFELGIERAVSIVNAGPIAQLPHNSSLTIETARSAAAHCVGFSEIDDCASAVLRYHFPEITNHGNVSQITWRDIPDFDLLVGGSPCQDFSLARLEKRGGLDGSKSILAFDYTRALQEKKPAYFLWENVRGVLSSNGGWDFAS